MSGSGISWAICKFAHRSRQITMPAPPTTQFFTGRMPFLPLNQQRQSTERQSWILHYYGTNAMCDKIGSFIHCHRFIGFRGQPHYCYRPFCQQPGFDLPRHTWSLMNRFWTGQGPCRANLHKWGVDRSPSCDCGQRQTMSHIVDTCPLTKLELGLNLLHEAESYGWNL